MTDFVPYNKKDFFFYSSENCDAEKCGDVKCGDIDYTSNISSKEKDKQLCLNSNLYNKISQIQQNHGGADQRYTDLTQKYYGDMFSIGYSITGIIIMFGIINYA